MIKFNKTHGSLIPRESFNVDVDTKKLREVNTRILGGGASQNFAAFKLIEYYIAYERPEYVVEIGSQKGGLSVYIGTIAAVTEQFLFHTFEINKSRDWSNREVEGSGHWFEKMESISPYCKSHEMNIFSRDTYNYINEYVSQYKSFIICDGGDKPRELALYSTLMKTGDTVMVHDFGNEITDSDIDYSIFEEYVPFSTRFTDNATLFKLLRKK